MSLRESLHFVFFLGNAMSGVDPSDATSTLDRITYIPSPGGNLEGVVVGIPTEYHIAEISDCVSVKFCRPTAPAMLLQCFPPFVFRDV